MKQRSSSLGSAMELPTSHTCDLSGEGCEAPM